MKNLKLRMTGLCSSCVNWQHCTLLASNTSPILQCEEFEVSRETTQPDMSQLMASIPDNRQPIKKPEQVINLKGLCVNCTMIDTCSLSSKDAGAWHCEEYR